MIFFFKEPIILTTDPESVKVYLAYNLSNHYLIPYNLNVQVIAMQSKLNKDPSNVSNLAHLFGER